MNARRFVMVTLILALSLIGLHSPASLYPEGTFDFKTMPVTSTLDATHLVVGEITAVSFVFELVFSEAPEHRSIYLLLGTNREWENMKGKLERKLSVATQFS